ncbi:MAG: Nramp family divalent metal transporter [candidate division SR1 bacterium]|nr:Nramp family divalent metal transporter [candidate division SR1 bacterium]
MKNSLIDLPKPKLTLLQMLGPSIVFVALSLNGGEILIWPDLVGRFGFQILWPIPLVLLLQYMVNLEIERYTIATGKNTVTGLLSLSRWLAPLFLIAIFISLVWPAWASIAGNMIAHLLGLDYKVYGAFCSTFLLFGLLFIWFSPGVYQFLEKLTRFGLLVILAIASVVIINLFNFQAISNSIQPVWFPTTPSDKITFLSGLAYGGVAGVLNLVQSDWVAKKKYAVASLQENKEINWNSETTRLNWKRWWSLIKKEHFTMFYVGNFVGILLIALVSLSTLTNQGLKGFSLLIYQVNLLNERFTILGTFWGIAIVVLFVMAQITILDAAGRLIKHSIGEKKMIKNISSERISQAFGLIGVVILSVAIFKPGFNQPSGLLEISASLSAFVMCLYPPILLRLNSKLPKVVRPGIVNTLFLWFTTLFYAGMVVWGVWGQF